MKWTLKEFEEFKSRAADVTTPGEPGALEPVGAVDRAVWDVITGMIGAPVFWMDVAPTSAEAPDIEQLAGTPREALGQMGRQLGELGIGGFSPEAPWEEYALSPEMMEEILPMAVELSAYPFMARTLTGTMGAMLTGAEEIYRGATLPYRLGRAGRRLTALGEEAVAGLEGLEMTVAAEDEIAVTLGLAGTPQAPPHPGATAVPNRPTQHTQAILDHLGRPAGIPPQARWTARQQTRIGMNRLRATLADEQAMLLKELEATGVDFSDPFNEVLEVTPDKFNRVHGAVIDTLRAEVPARQVSNIIEREIPELVRDPRFDVNVNVNKQRSMARRLNEGLPKGQRITVEEIGEAGQDPNMREKLAKLMVRHIHKQPWYKNRDQGFVDMALLMRLGEMGFGAVTGAAIDEENRLRGAIVGAGVAFALGTILRFGRTLNQRGVVEIGGRPKWVEKARERILGEVEAGIPVAEEATQAKGFTPAEAKTRGIRRKAQNTVFGLGTNQLGMTRDEIRAWVPEVFGKRLSDMTDAEIINKVIPAMESQPIVAELVGSASAVNVQRVKNIEDLAIEMYGAKAQKRVDRAVRATVGLHKDLRELDEKQLTSVLEVLPKRFLRGRGLGALSRQPLAVEDVLNRMGPMGKVITRTMRKERLHTEYLASKWVSPLREETRGLSRTDLDEIVAALHPMEANEFRTVPPSSERLGQIATRIRQDLNEIGQMRTDIGDPIRLASGETRPFEMMDNYYPLHIPPDELTSSIKIKRRIMDHLLETGQARGDTEALEIYHRFINRAVTNRFGNLDYAREAWVEPEQFDLVKDLSRYYYGAAKRVSRHMYYGRTGTHELPDRMMIWLDRLRKDVGVDEHEFARKALKRHFKHDAIDDAMSDMLKRVRSFETVAHMGLASIMNSSEPVHTAIWAGFRNFARGLTSALRSTSRMDARELITRNGAALGSTLRDMFGEAGGAGSLTSKFLRVTGFTPIEAWNRRLAGHVGLHYMEDTLAKLKRNPTSKRLRRMLDEVMVDADRALEVGLSEEEMIKAAMEVSNRTQKRTGVLDMPYFMSSPYGRIFTMFKTFAYGAARMMVRDVVRDPRRLARLLVAFPIVGEVIGDVRNLMTGTPRETEGLERLLENYAYVGTMGIAYDFFRSVQFGESSIKSFMLGPVGSDIATIMDGTYMWLMEGKGRKLGKQVVRMLPPPATLLRGRLFPPRAKKWTIG